MEKSEDDRESAVERQATVSRRAFVGAGVLGGAAALTGMRFPGIAAAGLARKETGAAGVAYTPGEFELEDATIAELQEGMRSGKYTARKLVELYLQRIDELDQSGPKLNQVLETNPDALEIADALDRERKSKGARGPLHGIPILLKDNIATSDRMATTAGSLALLGAVARKDAYVAHKLREAGAILLGKTNLSEWANFRSSNSSSGWSGRGGQGLNPYALDRTPSGSSAGSAAAVAANYSAAAIGTETNGSIVSPSAACSIVGIKPTVGLVSRAGVIPIAHSQDTAGPMARCVADAAAVLSALTGVDADDDATAASRGKIAPDYTKFLDADGLRGARIGVPRDRYFGYSTATDALIDAALGLMREHGAVIVDPIDLDIRLGDASYTVLLYEFKADLEKYFAGLASSPGIRTLADVIAFNEKHAERELPFFGQDIMIEAQKKGPLSTPEYQEALAKCRSLTREKGIDKVMDEHKLDAIVAPTHGPPGLIDLVNGDPGSGGSSSTPAAVAGYPSITVPAGYYFGLPVGMSFFGRAWSEPLLIKLAYAYEQAAKIRRPPSFAPSADIPWPGRPRES
ncbi:MAG TPA: amidase [Gemmatimonadaceae bacterium]|nr:amidase [Gemmatimonadaceae bacterium]